MNTLEGEIWDNLSVDEKVYTVISILNTPILKRRLNDPSLSKAILDIYTKLNIED
jgi:hypothetical protein